tara:strand:+ start:1939 stop:5511 length:3573 start_codon:yes stop_codon:yes gene_type:complete
MTNNDTSGYLKYLDYTLMSGRLPRNIKISNNNTISKNAQRRIRKEYNLRTTGKTKKQARKIIMDFAKDLRGGTSNFRNEIYAYRFLAQSFNVALQPIRRAIIKKRNEEKQKVLISITIRFRGWNRSKTGLFVLAKEALVNRSTTIEQKNVDKWIREQKREVLVMFQDSPFDKSKVEVVKKNSQNVTDPEPLEWTPIQIAGVMNLDNNVENARWCKNRNMCVVDLIQYRYANRKGFKKKNKTDELIEFWSTHHIDKLSITGYEIDYDIEDKGLMNPNKTGYTLNHIKVWCANFNVNMYCLIDGELVDHFHTERARELKNPPLVFELKNNHMYPILDTAKIKSITNKTKSEVEKNIKSDSQQQKKEKNPEEMDEHKDTDIQIKFLDPNVFASTKNNTYMEYACETMSQDNLMTYPAKNLTLYNGSLSSFKLGENKYLMIKDVVPDEKCINKTQLLNNRNLRCIKQYCLDNNIQYTGQTAPFFIQPYMKDLRLYCSSYYSKSVDKALNDGGVKMRVHYGAKNLYLGSEETMWKSTMSELWNYVLCYDVNKCYRSYMECPQEDWMTIGFQEEVRIWNNDKAFEQVELGLYYIKCANNDLFHYDNWYSSAIINYALKNTDIEFTIKYWIKGTKNDRTLLKDIIDQIKDDYTDIGLQKQMINSIYGYLMKTTNSKTLMNVDEDINRVWDNYIKIKGRKNETLDYDEVECSNGKKLYCYGRKIKTKIMNQNLPMAIQITDGGNIALYEMITRMRNTENSVLLYRNTDSAVVGYLNETDKELMKHKMDKYVNKEIGGYSMNYPPLLKDIYKEKEYEFRHHHYRYTEKKWNDITEYNDSDDWLDIISSLVEEGGGMLLGRAGTGKSYVCIQGMNALKKSGVKCKALAFTNKATIQLKGSTIHKFMTIDKNGKLNIKWAKEQAKHIDVIFIDEISMISSDLWKILAEFKYYTNLPFILIGDYRQLPPVKDTLLGASMDWFNHSTIKYLANNNRIELTAMKRYDIKLWNLLEDVWENDKLKNETECFLRNITPRSIEDMIECKNICYANSTRKMINMMVENHICPDDYIEIPYEDIENKYNQNMKVFIGSKIIMYHTTKCKTLKKNEEVEVVDYGNNWVELTNHNNVDKFRIEWKTFKDFHNKFLMGYATTIHKSQGDTINGIINIFDLNMIRDWLCDKRALYTALSRAKCLQNIRPSVIF